MITHEMLVAAIYDDNFVEACDYDCNKRISCEKCCEQMVSEYDDAIRADERKKVLEEVKEKIRNLNQLNCFVDYASDEIDLEELMYYASEEIIDQLKGEQT